MILRACTPSRLVDRQKLTIAPSIYNFLPGLQKCATNQAKRLDLPWEKIINSADNSMAVHNIEGGLRLLQFPFLAS